MNASILSVKRNREWGHQKKTATIAGVCALDIRSDLPEENRSIRIVNAVEREENIQQPLVQVLHLFE